MASTDNPASASSTSLARWPVTTMTGRADDPVAASAT